MQNGDIVRIGTGCPCTNDGIHHAEDWCRQCGGEAGLKLLALNVTLATEQRDNAEWKLRQIEKLLTDRGHPEVISPTETQSIGYRINKLCDMADELKALKQSTPAARPQKG